MMNKKKAVAGLTLTSMALSGANAVADAVAVDSYVATPVEAKAAAATVKVAGVKGAFSFNQDVLSPSEDVLNLYGTAVTGICAKPAFAFEPGKEEGGTHYVNVSGDMEFAYQLTEADFKTKSVNRVAACSCGMGPAVVQAQVSGIPLSNILSIASLCEGANTLTVEGSDGYKVSMPLSYALDRDAMLVYAINGEQLAANQRTQLWMPGAVARYFARDVVDIRVTAEAETPEIMTAEDEQRAKVCVMNDASTAKLKTFEAIQFEGYADDCGSPIEAVEFSLDGGETWTTYTTSDATTDRWVYWTFTYMPEAAGSYELQVRARTQDGTVSPMASSVTFEVEDQKA